MTRALAVVRITPSWLGGGKKMPHPSFFIRQPRATCVVHYPRPVLTMRRVVITGIGLVTPLGVGVEVNWRRLLAGEGAVRRLASLDALPVQIGASVPCGDAEGAFAPGRCSLSAPGDEANLSTFVQFALAAAAEALEHARWAPQTDEQRERTGVAIGSGIGASERASESQRAQHPLSPLSPLPVPPALQPAAFARAPTQAASPTSSRRRTRCASAACGASRPTSCQRCSSTWFVPCHYYTNTVLVI